MKFLGWKIWYKDRVVSSKECEWDDAPKDDIQVIICYYTSDKHNHITRIMYYGVDYYLLAGTKVISTNDKINNSSMKLGKAMSDIKFAGLLKSALKDKNW